MPSIKLTYFNFTGLGEAIRLALTVGGIDFEDERLDQEAFAEKKKAGELPYGQLPVLTIDGKTYAQSNALLRYAGKLAGLYPKDDDLTAILVDGPLEAMQDATVALFIDSSEKARKTFVEEKIPKFFGSLDRMIKESGGPYILGEKMSIADLKIYVTAGLVDGDMDLDHVPKGVLKQFDHIQKLIKAVSENDKVAEWNKNHA